jgi:hypothetical protein
MYVCKEGGKKWNPFLLFPRGQWLFKGVWQSSRQQEVVTLNCLITQWFTDLICWIFVFLIFFTLWSVEEFNFSRYSLNSIQYFYRSLKQVVSIYSAWLQIQRFGFDSRRYYIFWEVLGLERGLLSLMSTTEDLLERKSSGFVLEIGEYGRRDVTLTTWHQSAKVGTNFADKLLSLGRHNSLTNSGHGV